MNQQQPRAAELDAPTRAEISLKRQLIERIKANHLQRMEEAVHEGQQHEEHSNHHPSNSTAINPDCAFPGGSPGGVEQPDKNPGVTDTDKMIFDKRFKNYLNHRQEYIEKARGGSRVQGRGERKAPVELGDAGYYNQEEVLSNTGSEYQYQDASDMQAAYDQMTTGKRRKGGQALLFPCESFENELRQFQFEGLLAEGEEEERQLLSVSKDRLLNYLFDEPILMMLYSVNPYRLGDELAEFDTANLDLMNYLEFSAFLLADREPTYFQYTEANLNEAKKLGRGIKCGPIIAKWVDETGIFELLLEIFRSIDVRGDSRVDRTFLAKKLRKEASMRRILEAEVIEVVNISKHLPLSRLLYEVEYEQRGEDLCWSEEEFVEFLQHYRRRDTPEKDKLITKLILTGKYDSSYVYVVSQEVLEVVKDIFQKMPKFAEYFVLKEKLLQTLCSDPRYKKVQSMWVRTETNRYVKRETVEDTLVRILAEGDEYLDLEEVLDFLTNRGRPKLVEHRVYLQNLERQLAIIQEEERLRQEKGATCETASSDEEFSEAIRKKQIQRKRDKLKQIRNANNFKADKKFNVTIPQPYGFDLRDKDKKISIREKKLRDMLEEKQRRLREEMKPVPVKAVPECVKENLYARMLKEQERERKERLEKFRLEIMAQVKVSDSLMRPKSKELHCMLPGPEYKFAARPMPWYCEVRLIDRINHKKKERRERIIEEIIKKHTEYELPEGVERMIRRQEEREEKRADRARTASTGTLGECTFVPRISNGVPDFKTIHEHLHFDLENAKNVKAPIEVLPFSFDNRPARSRTTYEPKPKQRNQRFSKHERGEGEQDFQNIPKTQKFEALVELRRRQLYEKEREVERERRSDAVRKMRESKFAPVVWRALRNKAADPEKSRAIIASKIKEFKREERKKEENYENQMIRILTKVYERPLLLESEPEEGEEQDFQRGPAGSHHSKGIKQEFKYADENEYLESGYGRKQEAADLKLNLGKRKPAEKMDEDQRRAAVEGHHLGQYPPEGFEEEYEEEEEEQFQQSQLYAEDYQPGNLHTS